MCTLGGYNINMEDRRKPKKRLYADWWYEARAEREREEVKEAQDNNYLMFHYAMVFLVSMMAGAITAFAIAALPW